MKKWVIALILVFLICIISTQKQEQTQIQEQFTPYINSSYRPFVRQTRQHLENFPFPNLNRFYKYWGLL